MNHQYRRRPSIDLDLNETSWIPEINDRRKFTSGERLIVTLHLFVFVRGQNGWRLFWYTKNKVGVIGVNLWEGGAWDVLHCLTVIDDVILPASVA